MLSKLFFVFVATIAGTFCFAHESDSAVTEKYASLEQIIAHSETCVKDINENKIYLQEDKLFPTETGLFLALNDEEVVQIPELLSDEAGCFVKLPSNFRSSLSNVTEWPSGIEIFNTCPGCGRRYFVTCTNPTCPLNQPQPIDQPKPEPKGPKKGK